MKWQIGKSYFWLFPILAIPFFGIGIVSMHARHPEWAVAILPAIGLFLIISQLRSGVALDGMAKAVYAKPAWQYWTLLAWNITFTIGSSVMAVVIALTFRH